jgi:hypothetical protein
MALTYLGNEYGSVKRYCIHAKTGLVFKDTAPNFSIPGEKCSEYDNSE